MLAGLVERVTYHNSESQWSRDEGHSWGYLGRALSQNPCNILGNGDRDDGDHDGNSYLLDDGHAEHGSTAGKLGRQTGVLHDTGTSDKRLLLCQGICHSHPPAPWPH